MCVVLENLKFVDVCVVFECCGVGDGVGDVCGE